MTRALRLRVIFLPLGLGGCGALKLGVMNAAGPIAAAEWHLYLRLAVVLIFVAAPVLLLTPMMAWHYRQANKNNKFKPKWNFSWPLEGLIWVPPTGIVIGLGFLLWDSTHRLDPYRPIISAQPPLEIQAVAFDWKWLFIYPGLNVATVNRMQIPAGRPVHIQLTSGTVMQSMLIPRLTGQIYAMSGMRTELNFAADEPGVYRGENTQYNGVGFPRQKFEVVALSPAEYHRWEADAQSGGRPFSEADYAQLLERSVAPKPVVYARVPNGLFRRILTREKVPAGEMQR